MPRHTPGGHAPGRHQPGRHEPGGSAAGAGSPVAKEQNSTFQVMDFKTLATVYNTGARQVPSYVFSNGRRFVQTGDKET